MHGLCFVPPPVCGCPVFITGSDIDISVTMTERIGRKRPSSLGGYVEGELVFPVTCLLITDTLLIALCSLFMSPQTRTVPERLTDLLASSVFIGSTGEHETGPGHHLLPPSHPTPTKRRSTLKRRKRERRAPRALTNQDWGPKTSRVQVREEAELEGPL